MNCQTMLIEKLKLYGKGHRFLDDDLFSSEKLPIRLGVYDVDEESLCHQIVKSTCPIPGCQFTADTLLESENHYNTAHRYACSQCKKVMPSPHLLDLHIQETHDSYFSILSVKKPSYCCFIEECKEKFMTAEIRLKHCVTIHKLPKDFRFDLKPKNIKKSNKKKVDKVMEVDKVQNITLTNGKQKSFSSYSGKKFTNTLKTVVGRDINMDDAMDDLRNNLPE